MPIGRTTARACSGPSGPTRSRGARVTFEYVLLAGLNDTDADARRLVAAPARHPVEGEPHPWNPHPRSSSCGARRRSRWRGSRTCCGARGCGGTCARRGRRDRRRVRPARGAGGRTRAARRRSPKMAGARGAPGPARGGARGGRARSSRAPGALDTGWSWHTPADVRRRRPRAARGRAPVPLGQEVYGQLALFDPYLHPRGVKEMAAPKSLRLACAVVDLLRTLEGGRRRSACTRCAACARSAPQRQPDLRVNTARVLCTP